MALRKETKKFAPVVGMMSCVGIGGEYPHEFGNYMSLSEGPYICNMWGENLEGWVALNPDAGHIEVTIFHDECYAWRDKSKTIPCSVGIITDSRIPTSILAPEFHRLCVTGHGWGTVAIGKAIHEHLGLEFTEYCGCEDEHMSPSFMKSYVPDDGKRTDTCWNCNKSTTVQYKDPITEEEKRIRDENLNNLNTNIKIYEFKSDVLISPEALKDIKDWHIKKTDKDV